jgi:F-box and WD-40 domain protein 1/11
MTSLNTQHDSLRFSSSPPSPSSSLDFYLVNPPSPSPDRDATLYASHPGRSQPYLCYSGSSSRDKRFNPLHATHSSHRASGPQTGKSMKFLPRLWDALSSPTRKARRQTARRKPYALPSNISSYADLQPLDGEEGELIDDEACFVERDDAVPQSPRNLIGPRFHSFCCCVINSKNCTRCQTL